MVRHRADASERSSTTAAHPVPDPSYTDGDRARAAHTRDSNRTHDSEDPERYDAQRTPSPPGPEANAPPPEEEVTKLRLSAHWAGLVLASMVGCLVRLGLDALGEYDGRIIFPLAWSQGVGCAIMGMSIGLKNDIVAVYPPLYTFLTTGIAGSVTTFSSWMLEGYSSFSNQSNYRRSGFYDSTDGFAYSFSTYLISLGGLHIGAHLASIVSPLVAPWTSRRQAQAAHVHRAGPSKADNGEGDPPPTSTSPSPRHSAPLLDALTLFSALLAYLVALLLYFLAPHPWRHRATLPILLAPPGTLLRFGLSKLNPKRPFADRFPIGTFIANMVATLLISGMYAAQRIGIGPVGAVRCDALYAVQQGFCGCLSTVSTFVVETRSIRLKRWKWAYAGGSVVLGHVFVLAIVGGVGWTKGLGQACSGSD